MFKKRGLIFLTILFVLMLNTGCGRSDAASQQEDKPSGKTQAEDTAGYNASNGSGSGGVFGNYLDENKKAVAVLPEPWMAFPGSVVVTDWHAAGWSDYPSWLLAAPPGTKREEVIDYYLKAADERADFENRVVYHGVTGTWTWNDTEIMIEADYFYDDPELIQILFAFDSNYQ